MVSDTLHTMVHQLRLTHLPQTTAGQADTTNAIATTKLIFGSLVCRYANSPVRDLTKPEMKCNVMGEVPSNATIKVQPGDVVTYVPAVHITGFMPFILHHSLQS